MQRNVNKKASSVFSYITMMVIMIALGASDSMRGVFSPVFKEHFALDSAGFSLIVTVSYLGNLVFLLFGSNLADRFGLKRVFLCVLLCWIGAVLLYILTDNYYVLLACMFVTMGTSTLMNTFINLMSPLLFIAAPQLAVNTLFFVQGIGTSGSQALAGNFATTFSDWRITNGILLAIGAAGFLLLLGVKVSRNSPDAKSSAEQEVVPSADIAEAAAGGSDSSQLCPEQKSAEKSGGSEQQSGGKVSFRDVIKNKAFLLFVLMFGFYFIAEHGILNWLVLYCTDEFAFSQGKASVYLSLFFGGMTLGRLVLAPIVQKLGTSKSLKVFGGVGAALYVAGLAGAACFGLFAQGGAVSAVLLYVLAFSGFIISIVYPMMVMFIRSFFDESVISTATGTVISVATLFDIGFNMIFGKLADKVGFTYIILILPVSMVLYYVMFRRLYKGLDGVVTNAAVRTGKTED